MWLFTTLATISAACCGLYLLAIYDVLGRILRDCLDRDSVYSLHNPNHTLALLFDHEERCWLEAASAQMLLERWPTFHASEWTRLVALRKKSFTAGVVRDFRTVRIAMFKALVVSKGLETLAQHLHGRLQSLPQLSRRL